MKTKIQIKSIFGEILFEYEKENNSIEKTLMVALKQNADLRGAYLGGTDLRGANLRGADLRGADLRGADLRSADLRGADLRGANLEGTDLIGTDLRYANLEGTNLRNTNLIGTNLGGANLRNTDLRKANLIGTNLGGADLGGANLRNASLPIYCKWSVVFNSKKIKIGCEEKTVDEWEEWFNNSNEKFYTPRDTEDFARINAMFNACRAYITTMNEYEKTKKDTNNSYEKNT
ncbi:pentapeptide repeat-containing protein [Riemerella anatipestifer]|uniref:pentapeptide repeat-containing protein n=1 Tax=Riemerella anatipestifer TaxID=34085 RepID=UPI0020984A5B|nr:pentapeptide repeat-containing protein [Riemerella anatipestifer]MCO7317761.1 pentapeptide repeat-containing protein [Riemerella anatipestifer]MCW0473387.1 pentapeptide repeat-containing protein [Riemerella anatipestifer]MDY3396115.1 pentapeptide repeat-containing protein [Riemerella anatipestifer]MDY3408893.1 pentapeptide repeat-containing protein [Riemerella anatipestifer]MDY3421385.1 pentapeptide repeat-containing protein [Riemerella anatipestifer]